ncbi:hypothetical protein V6N12_034910 [Hibiscus sabdariffa]|uniref:Uncharacterized protein n=1 Tax=Hibiscus sabdariffa TaxID=183260 RepID=A0ABR2BQN4_9ROSI
MADEDKHEMASARGGKVEAHNSCFNCYGNRGQPANSNSWVVDSGATHHVTPDAAKVVQGVDYSAPASTSRASDAQVNLAVNNDQVYDLWHKRGDSVKSDSKSRLQGVQSFPFPVSNSTRHVVQNLHDAVQLTNSTHSSLHPQDRTSLSNDGQSFGGHASLPEVGEAAVEQGVQNAIEVDVGDENVFINGGGEAIWFKT